MARIDYNLIKRQVDEFQQKYGLSKTEPLDTRSLLLKLNVIAAFRPMSPTFSGMSLIDHMGGRYMLINSNMPLGRQNFTICHELYHLFVDPSHSPHNCGDGSQKPDAEKAADAFAALLLMPEEAILQMVPLKEIGTNMVSMPTLVRLENYFGVSRTAMFFRLVGLRLVDKNRKDELCSNPTKDARALGFPLHLYSPANANLIIGDIGEKAYLLFQQEKISEGHYLEILNKLESTHED
ncbi:MAG: ImmA/IrrE family metallo-endopeptidase [Bacteroidales bacterium]|nr:ImmA/IrrE family metallo-endopeptidase [Bacteroidales bacterium]